MIAYGFSFVLPFLLLAAALLRVTSRAGAVPRSAVAVAAAALTAVPIAGVPIARWFVNITGNLSITLAALVAVHVWRRLTGTALLDAGAWRAARWFGAMAGVALYPMALGVGRLDPYALGWRFSPLHLALWVVTVWLVLRGNRFGLVLAVPALAFDLGALESRNLWDYAVDPVLAFLSMAAVVRELIARVRAPGQSPRPTGEPARPVAATGPTSGFQEPDGASSGG